MGLSSKQVSSRGLDWKQALLESQNLEVPKAPPMRKNQQQQMSHNQQAAEALKCPRCESTNTKFCYYNNYNKSQPRHFCRACKRHWTKGGTLRNVPVGGGRKNKRVVKKSSTTTPTPHIATIQPPLAVADDQKHMNSSLYQGLTRPPPFLLQQNNLMMMSNRGIESKDFGVGNNNGIFLGSSFPPPPPPQSQSSIFPFSSSSFDTNTCSVSTSLQSSNVYNNCGEELRTMEETTISSMMPISTNTQPWEMLPTASATTSVGVGMQMSNCWSWEDLDSLVSTDLNNNPWDDDIKPN